MKIIQISLIGMLLLSGCAMIGARKGIKQKKVYPIETEHHVFDDIDDEYKLVGYFMRSKEKKLLKSLDDKGKAEYIARYWQSMDPSPVTEKNEFLEAIKERVDYSNTYLTTYWKGWKTDRGRIYIRHGQPFDIQKERSGMQSKFPNKEYEVWRYRIKENMTFIFLDLQQYGDMRLIYSNNDDFESSWVDWYDYLGETLNRLQLD